MFVESSAKNRMKKEKAGLRAAKVGQTKCHRESGAVDVSDQKVNPDDAAASQFDNLAFGRRTDYRFFIRFAIRKRFDSSRFICFFFIQGLGKGHSKSSDVSSRPITVSCDTSAADTR